MQQASKLPGVSVVTLSYGEPESVLAASGLNQQSLDSDFTTPGVTFLAASGDSGIYGNGGYQVAADYPAASPNIVSVGGTSIVIDSAGDYPGTGTLGRSRLGRRDAERDSRGRRWRPERRRARAGVAERRRPRQHRSHRRSRASRRLHGLRVGPGIRRLHQHAQRLFGLGVGGRLARRRGHQRRVSHLGRPDRDRRPGPGARRRHALDRLHPDPARALLASRRRFPRHPLRQQRRPRRARLRPGHRAGHAGRQPPGSRPRRLSARPAR